jgi:GNAT superfamily N-acetyltransferase
MSESWTMTLDATNEEAYAALQQDRIQNCFAIADLLPPFRQYTQIALAHDGRDRHAVCLVLRAPYLTVLTPFGDPEGVRALLDAMPLPDQPLIQTASEHVELLGKYYALPPKARQLLRMALTKDTFLRPQLPGVISVVRLSVADLPALLALYSTYTENQFRPDLVEQGIFCGIYADGRLVAAGGTHVVALPYALAVLGNILTHPHYRGHGYAHAITSALVTSLLEEGAQDVILNVAVDNRPALHVYKDLGFQPSCQIASIQGKRIARSPEREAQRGDGGSSGQ